MDWVESLQKALCRSTSQSFFCQLLLAEDTAQTLKGGGFETIKPSAGKTGPSHFDEVTDA